MNEHQGKDVASLRPALLERRYDEISPSSEARVAKLRGIRHLLVVAGPSGAGKSTFLAHMASSSLPEEVGRSIPPGAQDWMRLVCSGCDRWLPAITDASMREEIPGVVLHYDMTRGAAKKRDYANDPVLRLLHMAQSVTVITLVSPSDRIAAQLLRQTFGKSTKPIIRVKRLALGVSRVSRLYLRKLFLALAPALPTSLIRRLKQSNSALRTWQMINRKGEGKISKYEQSGWLEGIYRRWQAHLASVAAEGAVIKQIYLAPNPSMGPSERHGWHVVAIPDRHG